MKKILFFGLLLFVIFLSCKKTQDSGIQEVDCQIKNTIIGKWKFVSRKVTKYGTTQPATPATNLTTNFDNTSSVEFKSDNSYKWREAYNGTTYREQEGRFGCPLSNLSSSKLDIFKDYVSTTTIVETIDEISSTKLVFVYPIYDQNGVKAQTVTTELTK